ncbi:MAG TPA: avidin/streptavidin family protein [Thiobacillus sp.]|nr:avidin/streptavidin family protein [Thiobacillus sp.]
MEKLLGVLVVIFSLSISSFARADQVKEVQSLSSWTNQSGSTLYINNIGNNGLLTGTYINRAPGYGCQNIAYPVTGWVYGTAITFTTIWQSTESCNSITGWTGFLYNGQIQTLWQLVINGSSSTKQILQGADTFTWKANKTHKSLMIEK